MKQVEVESTVSGSQREKGNSSFGLDAAGVTSLAGSFPLTSRFRSCEREQVEFRWLLTFHSTRSRS